MYSFARFVSPLNSVFVGRGEFRGDGEAGRLQLSADYAFEIVWRVYPDGTLFNGGLDTPEVSPFALDLPRSEPVRTLGYRIRPEAVAALLRENLDDWHPGTVPLSELGGPLRHVSKATHRSELEERLLQALGKASEPDSQARAVMARLSSRAPGQSIETAVSGFGYSHSQLARRFRRSTGVSMERFGRLARLQNAQEDRLRTALPISMIAVRAGFADASHLGHECRRLTGRSFRDFALNFNLPR